MAVSNTAIIPNIKIPLTTSDGTITLAWWRYMHKANTTGSTVDLGPIESELNTLSAEVATAINLSTAASAAASEALLLSEVAFLQGVTNPPAPETRLADILSLSGPTIQDNSSDLSFVLGLGKVTEKPQTNAGPKTVTANYTVMASDYSLIFNGSNTIVTTMPNAVIYAGRFLNMKTLGNAVVSYSANIVPIDSAIANTSILSNVAGKWASLQSDGQNWVIMSAN